jgi:hypothetical protein
MSHPAHPGTHAWGVRMWELPKKKTPRMASRGFFLGFFVDMR